MDEQPLPGGRRAALVALSAIKPAEYARTRNFLSGAVTRLSPYLRHGVLTLAEVRNHVLANVNDPHDAEKLINELAWRDYWQRLYAVLGDGIWQDREKYKTGYPAKSYAAELPEPLLAAATNLACMDSFSKQLRDSGYLHNHARMWTAAYVVHHLHVRWQAGAAWFLQHLLDGDPASNNLSWQWVASTFSNKPYFFNRENLERYTEAKYCSVCPRRGDCPFEGTYEALEIKLFRQPAWELGVSLELSLTQDRKPAPAPPSNAKPLLWMHTDDLNPESKVLKDYPGAPATFVWDHAWLQQENIAGKRITFLEQCLSEMPVRLEQRKGDPAEEILAAAKSATADCIISTRTPDPRILAAAEKLERTLPIFWIDPPRFVDDRDYDLTRFSRYWKKARSSAMSSHLEA